MSQDMRRRAELLGVLAHHTRLSVVDKLKDGPKCVGDIRDLLNVTQPNLSQHLALLRREGIIDFYEEGNKRCYYITRPSMIQALMSILAEDYPVVSGCDTTECCDQ